MDEKPRSRWFRFSLRTALVLVAVLAIPLAWVGYSLNWIRQRHELIRRGGIKVTGIYDCHTNTFQPYKAPGALGWFGEQGAKDIYWKFKEPAAPAKEVVARLFPEAEIFSVEVEYLPRSQREIFRIVP